ncbi:PREDICTED: uncharacterized protein LOC104822975 isoform X2 [Tarenaya hassleriana]|uniref:uncharacterized protein LOC104822975 isoform X2 n=1 Tax=Tarenaya hassleriana TaxID=28532 RepID=UPI00053C2B53|nr:PREDICTED: uncharacterized protein LOC104822975 isoform X2 [Tarenaya hassleriana]
MSAQTNVPSYWLNWRFFLCAIFLLTAILLSSFLIWKLECSRKRKKRNDHHEFPGVVCEDEAWNTCTEGIHPNWLLGYRAFGFIVLLGLISGNAIADGTGIFIFYTQWTFTLVTIYFGLAASMSVYGCCVKPKRNSGNIDNRDEERGSYRPPIDGEIFDMIKAANAQEDCISECQIASIGGFILQILFQTCAGAVLLTDCVFWFVIYPFLTAKDYSLDFFIVIMHSVNAVFLLGETFLNSLRFPFFRIAYFVLWTGIFVIFQWIVHACISFWWPYPFLDLSSPYAPLWYAAVGIMHVPCFGIFALVVKLKYLWLSKLCP